MNKKVLKKLEGIEFLTNVNMFSYTSIKCSGRAKIIIFPKNINELKRALEACKKEEIFILGNGTNLIVSDSGFNGVMISLSKMQGNITQNGTELIVPAGVSLFDLNRYCKINCLSGLEFSFGIPGSVGGATYMNAGAYSHELSEFITGVDVINRNGNISFIDRDDIDFSYRYSGIKECILNVHFSLNDGCFKDISQLQLDYFLKRKSTQPLEHSSAGSVFKREKDIIPAEIIDKMGLKGVKIGGAEISNKHAGFIINKNGSSNDILKLIEYIKRRVREEKNIELKEEIIILGS